MTSFRTIVTELAPSPLGLLPARWHVEHCCRTCRAQVATADLVAHAQTHEGGIEQERGTIE